MNIGLECHKCRGDLKPQRKQPRRLREYSIRLYQCLNCRRRIAVASFILTESKARWMERIYEEHTEDSGL